MNTPAHAALSLIVLGRDERNVLPVAIGAVAPDLPMVAFYAWERLGRQVPEGLIWSERYYDPAWQTVFNIPHSIPILGLATAVLLVVGRGRTTSGSEGPSRRRLSRWWALFLGSMLIHAFADLPLHREDAHAHFFPLSDWKFVSPVSYWDPRHFGIYAIGAEIALVTAVSIYLFRHYRQRGRWIIGILGALYALFAVFAIFSWSGMMG